MSHWASTWAYEQDIQPCGRKFVLVALAGFADEEGFCYPSQETIAKMTGQDARSVQRHLKALEKDGLIKRKARWKKAGGRNSDGYTLQAPASRLRPNTTNCQVSRATDCPVDKLSPDLSEDRKDPSVKKEPPLPPKGKRDPVYAIEDLKDPDTIPGLRNQLAIYQHVPFDDGYAGWFGKYFPKGGIGRVPGSKCTLAQYATHVESYFRTWERNAVSRNGNGLLPAEQPRMKTIKERMEAGEL